MSSFSVCSGTLRRVRLLLLVDDLREGDLGEVVLRVVVDDLHFFARADHLGDLEERDVAAVLRVVELPVRVALDDASADVLDDVAGGDAAVSGFVSKIVLLRARFDDGALRIQDTLTRGVNT